MIRWTKFPRVHRSYPQKIRPKWVIPGVAAVLSIGFFYYTHILVTQVKEREIANIHLYARALEYTLNSESGNVVFATEEIIYKNHSIPSILTDEAGKIIFFENLCIDPLLPIKKKNEILHKELADMKNMYPPIEIILKDPGTGEVFGKQFIYYKNSHLLIQLTIYPYVQLFFLTVFAFIAYLAFNYSKANEQNQLWIGLAKETAHQIGTPVSSLMAWTETLRDDPEVKNKDIINELEKDIQKLRIVTQRFSSIGSAPVLKTQNVYRTIYEVTQYLRPRISSQINLQIQAASKSVTTPMHAPLLEWVIETLCKNAVDAIGQKGNITLTIGEKTRHILFIDVTDTGKGIPKFMIRKIFEPGFTTKKHGWGLGLTLAKRIIEQYHKGKITVKHTGKKQGTTFRIELNKTHKNG